MIKHIARPFALTLILGASTLANFGIAHAQTTTPSTGGASTNGITGTDPCPRNTQCAASSSTTTAPSTTAGSPVASGTVLQTLLVLFGMA